MTTGAISTGNAHKQFYAWNSKGWIFNCKKKSNIADPEIQLKWTGMVPLLKVYCLKNLLKSVDFKFVEQISWMPASWQPERRENILIYLQKILQSLMYCWGWWNPKKSSSYFFLNPRQLSDLWKSQKKKGKVGKKSFSVFLAIKTNVMIKYLDSDGHKCKHWSLFSVLF